MPPQLSPMTASEAATETIYQVAMEQSKFWKNVDPKACEPIEGQCMRSQTTLGWCLTKWLACRDGACSRRSSRYVILRVPRISFSSQSQHRIVEIPPSRLSVQEPRDGRGTSHESGPDRTLPDPGRLHVGIVQSVFILSSYCLYSPDIMENNTLVVFVHEL